MRMTAGLTLRCGTYGGHRNALVEPQKLRRHGSAQKTLRWKCRKPPLPHLWACCPALLGRSLAPAWQSYGSGETEGSPQRASALMTRQRRLDHSVVMVRALPLLQRSAVPQRHQLLRQPHSSIPAPHALHPVMRQRHIALAAGTAASRRERCCQSAGKACSAGAAAAWPACKGSGGARGSSKASTAI